MSNLEERGMKIVAEQPGAEKSEISLSSSSQMSNLEGRVMQIVAEQLGVEESEISLSSSFVDDLGADSLATVDLIMALEDAFNCQIPDEKSQEITTVQGAIDYIKANPSEPSA